MRNINLNLPYDDIYCIDINENHKLRIITKNQELITTMAYQECQQILLSDKRFLECHYRIIINMDYVTSMKSEDFILKNGECQKFCVSPIADRVRTPLPIANTQKNLHSRKMA